MLYILLSQSVQLLNLRYLEKLLRLLDVKDSPTLSLVFRCKLARALQFCHKIFFATRHQMNDLKGTNNGFYVTFYGYFESL